MGTNPELSAFDFFPATREAALERLHAFTPQMAEIYKAERNTDHGPENRSNISCLSPFHSHRLLMERETIEQVLDKHSMADAEAFIDEVYWRTYFKGWMEHHPAVWAQTKAKVKAEITGLQDAQKDAYHQACAGETGIECFDAWAKELVETGYLHNHARMWFASIWIFTLKLDWALGADFFLRNLLDGDAASNTLSWRWVAGLHTKGKTYAANAANIAEFTSGRFNPEGRLEENPVALVDDWNDNMVALPAPAEVDFEATTLLLLHEDDLGFDSMPILDDIPLVGVGGVTITDGRSPYGASERVKQFTIEAVEDALNRADDRMSCPAVKLASPEGLADHAAEIGATQVVYPYAPIGPVRDRIDAAAEGWRAAGLKVKPILRDSDREAWAHCAGSFAGLKKNIPELLGQS